MSKKKKNKNRFGFNMLFVCDLKFIFSIAPFVCPYCPNMYISMINAVQHVEALHPGLDMSGIKR